jgi:hypothetical protein
MVFKKGPTKKVKLKDMRSISSLRLLKKKCYSDIKINIIINIILVFTLSELVFKLINLLFNLIYIVLSLFKINELIFKLAVSVK